MLFTFSILLLCQCIGEAIAFLLRVPVPGPVIGMVVLFCTLIVRPTLMDRIQPTAEALLRHLSLLFVPAGVGIFAASATLHGQWVAVMAGAVASTLLTLAVTALVMHHWSPTVGQGDAKSRDE